jgi:hypothetical protein
MTTTIHGDGKTDGGDYDVLQNDEKIGKLRWGTGADAGWFFIPHVNSYIKICDLDPDRSLEEVFRLTREKLDPTWQSAAVPHPSLVANLLQFAFGDSLFTNDYDGLTPAEQALISREQLTDVASWVANTVKVFVIKQGDTYAGRKRFVSRWWSQNTAQEYAKHMLAGAGVVEEVTLQRWKELCDE